MTRRAMPVPIDECGPLRPIIDAAARGTQLSRLRTFVGVCPRGHTLVEVFPTAAGNFAVWTEQGLDYRLLGAASTTDELDSEALSASDAELARRVDDLVPGHRRDRRKMAALISGELYPGATPARLASGAFRPRCRCTHDASVDFSAIDQFIADGVARAVVCQVRYSRQQVAHS